MNAATKRKFHALLGKAEAGVSFLIQYRKAVRASNKLNLSDAYLDPLRTLSSYHCGAVLAQIRFAGREAIFHDGGLIRENRKALARAIRAGIADGKAMAKHLLP